MLLDGVSNELAIVDFPPPHFARITVQLEIKFLLLFYNATAIYWACAAKNKFKKKSLPFTVN